MTQIELSLLREISEKLVDDLNLAWSPTSQIKAKLLRTEVNSQFVAIAPPDAKMIQVNFETEFNEIKGKFEIVYPYSTLFPMRNELFSVE